MKNIIIVLCIVVILLITGCDISNNPTSKTEEYLTKYQMLDIEIDTSYISNIVINNKEKDYEELIKRQYKNLVYEIKNETIDGNSAIVKAEIEVFDYKSIIESNKEDILDKLKKNKKKITYTIDFNITKDKKGKWHLTEISEEDKLKLIGMK